MESFGKLPLAAPLARLGLEIPRLDRFASSSIVI
jgi:hypothetical protein